MNVTWHDTYLALSWLDNTWAVWTDQACLCLRFHDRLNLDHIESWDTLGDANYEVHLGLNSLKNGISRKRWWHVDHRSLCVSCLLSLSYVAEDGKTQMLGTCFLLVNTTYNLGSIGN